MSRPHRVDLASALALCAVVPVGCTAAPRPYRLRYDAVDADTAQQIEAMVAAGTAAVQAFFGEPFPAPFTVHVCADREAFDASFPPEWGIARTQPWMVATGVATDLRILSPRVWASEAGGHDPDDREHVAGIVTHELVHVFHGQHNPTGDFTGCEPIGWFVEGLAVLVSGQLDQGHRERAAAAVATGAAPRRLATAWSGDYRYGVCGSLVEFVDLTYGRDMLRRLLPATTAAQLMSTLGVAEAELLRRWTAFVRRGSLGRVAQRPG